ncbi:MAG: NAD(P)-dependent oxidoreductase [Pseudomonadota bacterium]
MPRKTILITGATGNLGTKLRAHLEADGNYDLRLLCLNAGSVPGVTTADLSVYDEAWAQQFEGVDAVVHLAAHPSPQIDWPTAQKLNLDLTFNVYDAAAKYGAKRVVFASSNWVMAGYRFKGQRLTTDLPPWPLNPYGISKLIGERAGKSLAEQRGVSFVAMRIGYIQKGENLPGPKMNQADWGQHMWLSNRDFCHGFERAAIAEGVNFAVLNHMSDNAGMPWDIDETRKMIGYAPQDGHDADVTDEKKLRSATLKEKYELVEQLEKLFPSGAY